MVSEDSPAQLLLGHQPGAKTLPLPTTTKKLSSWFTAKEDEVPRTEGQSEAEPSSSPLSLSSITLTPFPTS